MTTFNNAFDDDERDEDDEEPAFVCEYGTVHEVNYETLEVKALIPSVDPNRVHDRWIKQMVPWVGSPGYGPAYAPAVGTEVLVTGRYGEPFTLYYTSVYNEEYPPPGEFADGARGLKTDGDLRLISDGDLYLRGGRVILEADASIRITAPGGFFVNDKRIA